MKVLINKRDNTKAMIVAVNKEDAEALELFYSNRIIFGLYKIWIRNPQKKGESRQEIQEVMKLLPDVQGVGWLNLVGGFVPPEQLAVLHEEFELQF